MTREQAGRPGITWEHHLVRREVVIPDGPWGGSATFTLWATDGNQPAEPRPNRATRRALARANRQKGHRR